MKPLLALHGIAKSYPGVRALAGIDFELVRGEVHALVGENGAGKSTLMKVLAGAEQPDAGEMVLDGSRFEPKDPRDALARGITLIHQEFSLVPEMSCAENVFLGREPMLRFGFVDGRRMEREAGAAMRELGLERDPRTKVGSLSVAEQQIVEIARALTGKARVLALDEPSATLTGRELARLFAVIRRLAREGVGIVYISHRLEEVFEIADRVTVIRDGTRIGTGSVGDLSRVEIVRMMVGRDVGEEFPARQVGAGDEVLRVEGLTGPGYRDVSFALRRGEVLGIAGLVGAGRTELAMGLVGAPPPVAGRIFVEGKEVSVADPRRALALGIGILTEDRKRLGIVPERPVRENMSLAALDRFVLGCGVVNGRREREATGVMIEQLRIRGAGGGEGLMKNLSGGNQQKALVARLLLTGVKVFVCDEPTRGVDVGAKAEIYALLNGLAEKGAGVLLVSSELVEVIGLSDRVMVMCAGRVAGVLGGGGDGGGEVTAERVMDLATGGGGEAAGD